MTTPRPRLCFRHARDIPDEVFLDAVRAATRGPWATRWDVEAALAGLPVPRDFDANRDIPGVPPKVVLAKARRLINRGLLWGCACGCRGDFQITP